MRGCGVLLHITSLPGPGGIGCMGAEARRFVDFLRAAGQGYWQVLPLTPPARGDSPYSSNSVFAGNPWLIDLAPLEKEGLLTPEDLAPLPVESLDKADFAACKKHRVKLLRKAFLAAKGRYDDKIAAFQEENAFWLEDYALFMALKKKLRQRPCAKWEPSVRGRKPEALTAVRRELSAEIRFWAFAQYLFFSQWKNLKDYANKQGIKLIGDMPIYADMDSADVWANPDVFQVTRELAQKAVAGVPPDAFSASGQLWGNPLYNWAALKKTGWRWWMERLKHAAKLYDVCRIDHFRAFDTYWSVPATARTARLGAWKKGPGIEFLHAAKEAAPRLSLIAEDLGLLSPSVNRLIEKSGLPGMKVLEFAFDPKEESTYLPHNLPRHCVAYIGTHDNDTAKGWMQSAPPEHALHAKEYLRLAEKEAHWDFIRALYMTVAELAVVQMQDFLGLGSEARMNTPGVAKGNWGWRLAQGQLTPSLAARIKKLALLYGRAEKSAKTTLTAKK